MPTTRHSLVVVGFCVVVSFNVDSQNQIWILSTTSQRSYLHSSWCLFFRLWPCVVFHGNVTIEGPMGLPCSLQGAAYLLLSWWWRDCPMPFLDSLTNRVLLFLRFANTSVVVMNFWAITKMSYKSNKEKKMNKPNAAPSPNSSRPLTPGPSAVLALAFRSLQLVDARLTSFIRIGTVSCGRPRCHRAAVGFYFATCVI